ncbi:hypothetical protein DP153_00165 [Clostridium tetani]|uniref:Uncharacterized protein n=1 Tax=Clostridium tetani (strain Massachusetts / E88) TaxID=212717 RepID=Q899V8_CLOTE|nr:hypothetical protein [Clostridium tetani]AAO37451.1 hypothetical protein CTC_p57 [Clostridium tetani E88]KGI36638.1 hypothetical protein KY52_13005 [Clostridium tetani]KHO30764.1 hypothetical protein OR63_13935 [Clostridium tetani]KIG19887.1 hypothetical protein RS78_12625 [Clostridium tetani]QBD86139.1 hypothetical protein EQG73_12835 [Clostridium tetani]
MNNKFLDNLQRDILDKKGYYTLYAFIFILSFVITIEDIKLYLNIFRIILSGGALFFLGLIYFKCKDLRDDKDNKVIIQNIFFFIILTFTCIYIFIKNLIL